MQQIESLTHSGAFCLSHAPSEPYGANTTNHDYWHPLRSGFATAAHARRLSATDLVEFVLRPAPEPGDPRFAYRRDSAINYFTSLAPRMKDHSFVGEDEVRFVYSKLPQLSERFRPGFRGVTPYFALGIADANYAVNADQPLSTSVVRGTNGVPFDPQMEDVIKQLQEINSFPTSVVFSKVPFRF